MSGSVPRAVPTHSNNSGRGATTIRTPGIVRIAAILMDTGTFLERDSMNHGFEYEEQLGDGAAGLRLLDYLSGRYRHSSRDLWRQRIESGLVLVEGRTASPETFLQAGWDVVWKRPPWREPAAPLCFAVLHRDADLIAVAKPAGLPTMPGGGYLEHTLLSLVSRHDPGAHPLHRLDRGTSGIVLFARTARARSGVGASWRTGVVRRIYRGLISGSPARESFVIDRPIGRIAWPGSHGISACDPAGRPARTDVRVLEWRAGTTLVEITIATGRPHQIRIHLAAAGHPLVGEPLYGPGGCPERPGRARPGEGGYLLHAGELSLPHPRDGRRISISCSPSPSLRCRSGLQ
ncbi:MAG: pseudouridine synthase [Acidobacteria bacterium]|nr:pseudouridine synthase [Acidobacteriota bacterium]